MQIINEQLWEVSSSGTKSIKLCNNKLGERAVSTLYVNPLSDATVVVKGFVADDDSTGITLKCVDIANLAKCDSVTVAGNYLYIVEPYYKVSIAVTGTANILIKELA